MKSVCFLIFFILCLVTPTLVIATNTTASSSLQSAIILVDHARIRSEPNLSASILETKDIGDNIPIYNRVIGDWFSALCIWGSSGCISTDEWLQTRLSDGRTGYIWSGLTNAVNHSRPNTSLPPQEFVSCIDPGNELTFTYLTYKNREIIDPTIIQEIVSQMYHWTGWDNWLGYPPNSEVYDRNGDGQDDLPEGKYIRYGFGLPPDLDEVMTVWLYDGAGAKRKVVIYRSESYSDMYYIIPFQNTEAYARPDGRYYGIHPCGTRSVPRDQVVPVINRIETESSTVGYSLSLSIDS